MRKLLSLVVAGMAGGLIVFAGILLLSQEEIKTKNRQAHFAESRILESIPTDFKSAARQAMPAVVHINAEESREGALRRFNEERTRRSPFSFFFDEDLFDAFRSPRQRAGKGSGVIISSDGYIVTNNHVIDFADQIEVTLHDDRKFLADLIGNDPRTDLAVIKIDAGVLPSLTYGNSDNVEVGEWVLAVGNPFDLTSTVTAGIVSAKGRNQIIRRTDAIEDFIQTDAVVNPGNSGGALVNTFGELIGVNTAIATPTGVFAGYSFAIPSNMLKEVVANIIEHGGPRGRMGAGIATIEEFEESMNLKLSVDRGVVVVSVEDGSAAQYSGILPHDVIIEADGMIIDSPETLVEILTKKRIGDMINLTIIRSGEEKVISVQLKAS